MQTAFFESVRVLEPSTLGFLFATLATAFVLKRKFNPYKSIQGNTTKVA